MISNIKPVYRIIEGSRDYIQKILNQWISTGYNMKVEFFFLTSSNKNPQINLYTAVIRRWRD